MESSPQSHAAAADSSGTGKSLPLVLIGCVVTPETAPYLPTWWTALCQQDYPPENIHAYVLGEPDDAAWAACEHLRDNLAPLSGSCCRLTVERGALAWAGTFDDLWQGTRWERGRTTLLRQQVLTAFAGQALEVSPATILAFWDPDLFWTPNFVRQFVSALSGDAQICAGIYGQHAQDLPAVWMPQADGSRRVASLEKKGGMPLPGVPCTTFEPGIGGFAASGAVWTDFLRRARGWRGYRRQGGYGASQDKADDKGAGATVLEAGHLLQSLAIDGAPPPWIPLGDVTAWHPTGDGIDLRLCRCAPGDVPDAPRWRMDARASALPPTLSSLWAAPEATLQLLDVRRAARHCPSAFAPHAALTIATQLPDIKAYAIPHFLRALRSQSDTHDLSRVRLLILCDGPSHLALPVLREWALSDEARAFALVDVAEHVSPPRGHYPEFLSAQRNAWLRQVQLERYLALPPDDGLFWWDVDQAWDPGILGRAAGCGWPVAAAPYINRVDFSMCSFMTGRAGNLEPVTGYFGAHLPFIRCHGLGGYFGTRALWEWFAAHGGFSTYVPHVPYGERGQFYDIGEDVMCHLMLPVLALWLRGDACWHVDGDGSAVRAAYSEQDRCWNWKFVRPDGTVVRERVYTADDYEEWGDSLRERSRSGTSRGEERAGRQ